MKKETVLAFCLVVVCIVAQHNSFACLREQHESRQHIAEQAKVLDDDIDGIYDHVEGSRMDLAEDHIDISVDFGTDNLLVNENVDVIEINGVINIETGKLIASKDRLPLNLALVLDVSGSMSGKPIKTSVASVLAIIDTLKEGDILTVITYSYTSTIVINTQTINGKQNQREHLKRKVRQGVIASGATNMWSGIDQALTTLKTLSYETMDSRIFLFSDGHVNEGASKQDIIENLKKEEFVHIRMSAFGIGYSFDERLMSSISEFGNGIYYHIANVQDSEAIVSKAFKNVAGSLGKGAVLKIKGLENVQIQEVYNHPNFLKGIKVGSLMSDDLRTFVFRGTVSIKDLYKTGIYTEGSMVPILEYELSFVPSYETEKRTYTKGTSSMKAVAKESDVRHNIEVEIQVKQQQASEISGKIAEGISTGKMNKEEWSSLSEKQIKILEVAAALDFTINNKFKIKVELDLLKAYKRDLDAGKVLGNLAKDYAQQHYKSRVWAQSVSYSSGKSTTDQVVDTLHDVVNSFINKFV